MAGTMYSVNANVQTALMNKETDGPIGVQSFYGKGLARSESEAVEKAVANVKIGVKELADLLDNASQK